MTAHAEMQVRVGNGSPSSGGEAHAAGSPNGFPTFARHALAMWPCIDGPLWMTAGELGAWLELNQDKRVPACKSRTRPHRGEPRPRGKQMRRIAAAPRGLLAPRGVRWNVPRGASITHPEKAAPWASPGEAAPVTGEGKRPAPANGSQALERDILSINRALNVRRASRRFCRHAPSACGSTLTCGSSVPVSSTSLSQHTAPRAPTRSKRAGNRTLSDHIIIYLQRKRTMTYASRSCNFTTLIVLLVLIVMPFILLGVPLVPLLLEPDVAIEKHRKCLA